MTHMRSMVMAAALARQVARPRRNFHRLLSTETKVNSGGFSYPAPRTLQEIVKLELLAKEESDSIAQIWSKYHEDKSDAIATTLPGKDFSSFRDRARHSPFFIFPVYRQEGFFNMLCQFQDKCFLVTTLEAFKENPALAPPCLTISLYDELLESKSVGLLRVDVTNVLDKPVCRSPHPNEQCCHRRL